MTREDNEARLAVEVALFHEGLIKPFQKHCILNPDVYCKNQQTQARFTEATLLGTGDAYVHGPDVAVEVIHRGETAPLLGMSQHRARVASTAHASPCHRVLRALDARVRSGEHFLAAKRPREALLTLDAVLGDLVAATGCIEATALESRARCAVSHASLRMGLAGRARNEACRALMLAPNDRQREACHFCVGCALTVLGAYAEANDELAAAGCTELVHAARRAICAKASRAGVTLASPAAKQLLTADGSQFPLLSAADGLSVAQLILSTWGAVTPWCYGHAHDVGGQSHDWSTAATPTAFLQTAVAVFKNAGFDEHHALAALHVCRNELAKACDWLFVHRFAGDLSQACMIEAGMIDRSG
mmetsp:Transcript_2999/g.8763  ORF Transcript_2999/g.8763 Transcript_2999/m.8763 type:complete len:360 (-) Transcript_2999:38-1117(-)